MSCSTRRGGSALRRATTSCSNSRRRSDRTASCSRRTWMACTPRTRNAPWTRLGLTWSTRRRWDGSSGSRGARPSSARGWWPRVSEPSRTEQRKAEHVNIILQENVSAEYNYWNDVHLVHKALPEIDLDDIDVSCTLFGHKLNAPLVISSMTGGFGMAREINANLAKAAAEVGVAMGVGSQRAALEKPDLVDTYAGVKDHDVPLRFANLGAPQLVPQEGKRAYGLEDARRAMAMVDAHMLIIHLNFLQEVVQPEGDRRARGVLDAIARLASKLPVVAKETGAGVSREVAVALKKAGVRGIDVGGLGGTSFSAVEYYRAKKDSATLKERLGATFWNWGIPTPASVV